MSAANFGLVTRGEHGEEASSRSQGATRSDTQNTLLCGAPPAGGSPFEEVGVERGTVKIDIFLFL